MPFPLLVARVKLWVQRSSEDVRNELRINKAKTEFQSTMQK